MVQKQFNLLFLCGFLASCTAPEFKALENVTLTCASDDDCPDGYYCEGRLDPKECLENADRDETPPVLSEVSLNLTHAKAGDELVAEFVSSEALLLEETTVSFDSHEFILDEEASDEAAQKLVYRYTLTGEEGDGIKVVSVDAVDEGGSATQQELGTVNLDFTSPVMVAANSNLQKYVKGDSITYTLRFSEALSDAPSLTVTRYEVAEPAGFFVLNADASDAATYVYDLAAGTVEPMHNGTYQVEITGLVDEVGNPSAEAVLTGGGFAVDAADPFLTASLLVDATGTVMEPVNRTPQNTLKIGETLVICLDVMEENLQTLSVSLGETDLEPSEATYDDCGDRQVYTYAVTDASPHGLVFVAIDAQDTFGNRANISPEIIFDVQPPQLTMVAFSPTAIRGGMTAKLLISADEKVSGTPILTWEGEGLDIPLSASTDVGFEYNIFATANSPDATYTLKSVTLQDEVGNANTFEVSELGDHVTVSPSLRIDATRPTLSGFSVNADRFGPNTDPLTVSFTVSEPLDNDTAEEANPKVTLGEAGIPIACNHEQAPSYSCTYPLMSELEDGNHLVSVQVKDEVGNYGPASTVVTVDFTAPVLLSYDVSPQQAQLEDTVLVTLAFNEAIAGTPNITSPNDILSFAYDAVLSTANTLIYALVVDGETPQGVFSLGYAVEDEVGNTKIANFLSQDEGLLIDTEEPVIYQMYFAQEDKRHYSLQAEHNVMSLSVSLSESLVQVEVAMGAAVFDCGDTIGLSAFTCVYPLTADDIPENTELVKSVQISGQDGAGNGVADSRTVTLDNRAPQLITSQITPLFANAEDAPVVSVTFDEPLSGAPSLFNSNGDIPLELDVTVAGSDTFWVFFGDLEGIADNDTGYAFEVVAVDEVGNETDAISLPESLVVDTVAPTVHVSLQDNKDHFSLEPGHNQVDVRLSLAENDMPANLTVTFVGAPDEAVSGPGSNTVLDCVTLDSEGKLSCVHDLELEDMPMAGFGNEVGLVIVEASDAAGNTNVLSQSVTLDNRAPHIAVANLTYFPDVTNPLVSVDVATHGTLVSLNVVADELLDGDFQPVAQAVGEGDENIDFSLLELTTAGAVFNYVVPAVGPDDGEYSLTLQWRDQVGNETTLTYNLFPDDAQSIRIKTAQPALVVDQLSVTFLRSPWGNAAAETITDGINTFEIPAGPYYALAPHHPLNPAVGLPANTFAFTDTAETLAMIRIFSSALARPMDLLGQMTPNGSENGWERLQLTPTNAVSVYAVGVDSAGNQSEPVTLRFGEWVATPNVPENEINPHVLLSRTDGLFAPDDQADGVNVFDETGGAGVVGFYDEVTLEKTGDLLGTEDRQWTDSGHQWSDDENSYRVFSHNLLSQDPLGKVIMLTGNEVACNDPLGLGYCGGLGTTETWIWDGATWLNANAVTPNVDGMKNGPITYDTERNLVVLLVWSPTNNSLAQMWEWDGYSWLEVGGTMPPFDWETSQLAYDRKRNKLVWITPAVLGDHDGDIQTWEWSENQGWHDVTPLNDEGEPDLNPKVRLFPGIGYDPNSQRIILFGGGWNQNNQPGGTWAWDGEAWEKLSPPTAPSERSFTQLVLDERRNRLVLFGGISGTDEDFNPGSALAATRNDTWEWDGNNWMALEGHENMPTPRSDLSLGYDPKAETVVLYGGRLYSDNEPEYYHPLSQTWLLPSGEPLPSFMFKVDLIFAGIPVNQLVQQNRGLEVRGRAGTPTDSEEWQAAEFALGTVGDQWETIGDPDSSDGLFHWENNNLSENVDFFHDINEAVLVKIDTATADDGNRHTDLSLDYLEVRLRYAILPEDCGDGTLDAQAGEICDEGANNNDELPDACRTNCSTAYCGDSVIDTGEVCDGDTDDYWCSSDCWFELAKPEDNSDLDGGMGDESDAGISDESDAGPTPTDGGL